MIPALGALFGCAALALGLGWLRRSEAAGQRPLTKALPLLGALIACLVSGVGTGAMGGSGIEHPAVFDVVVIGFALIIGAAVGALLARDWYARRGPHR